MHGKRVGNDAFWGGVEKARHADPTFDLERIFPPVDGTGAAARRGSKRRGSNRRGTAGRGGNSRGNKGRGGDSRGNAGRGGDSRGNAGRGGDSGFDHKHVVIRGVNCHEWRPKKGPKKGAARPGEKRKRDDDDGALQKLQRDALCSDEALQEVMANDAERQRQFEVWQKRWEKANKNKTRPPPGTRKEPPKGVRRTRKHWLKPSAKQRRVLNHLIAGARCVYNAAVEEIRKDYMPNKSSVNMQRLRDLLFHKMESDDSLDWVKFIPYAIKEGAVADAVRAYKSSLTQLKQGRITHFELKFRSYRKTLTESICVPRTSVSFSSYPNPTSRRKICLKAYTRKLGRCGMPLHDSRSMCDRLVAAGRPEMECRIQWCKRTNQYFLCLPYTLEPRAEDLTEEQLLTEGRLMAIDPGVRTLASYYCANGEHGKLADGDCKSRIMPLLKKADKMKRLAMKEPNRKRRKRLWRGHHRRLDRAKNIRTAAHGVAIQEMWKRADVVLLPRLQTRRLGRKKDEHSGKPRPMGKGTVREMQAWAHYQFFKALVFSAARGKHRRVVWVEEGYTTKTCGRCGTVHDNVGGAEVFTCPSPSCDYRADRDLNAARSIAIRGLLYGPVTVLDRLSEGIPPLNAVSGGEPSPNDDDTPA